MTSSLSSLFSSPGQALGGGAGAAPSGGASQGGGNFLGGLVSTFAQVIPNMLGAIPIIGPFISAAMPLVTGLTGALTGAQQTRTTSSGNGTMDAATAAALVKYMQQQQAANAAATAGGGAPAMTPQRIIAANTPSATKPPELHMTGTANQIATMQNALSAFSKQDAGAQLFHQLDGREVDITVINDAAYAQLQRSGYTAGNGVIYVRESDIGDTNALLNTLANGLSITANQLTTLG